MTNKTYYRIVTCSCVVLGSAVGGAGFMIGYGWQGIAAVAIFNAGSLYGAWTSRIYLKARRDEDQARNERPYYDAQ